METLNAVGVGVLVFKILPNLDAITGKFLNYEIRPLKY